MSGAIGYVPGGPQSPDEGGVILQNTCTAGCDSGSTAENPIGCCPLKWTTVAEVRNAVPILDYLSTDHMPTLFSEREIYYNACNAKIKLVHTRYWCRLACLPR